MHITVNRHDILEPLQQVRQAVNVRSPLPIMAGILFVASKNGLKLVGSDTAISIIRTIPAEKVDVKRLGSAVLPADKVFEIIKSLPGNEVEIKMTDLKAQISSERSKVQLVGMGADEYNYKKISNEPDFKMPGSTLRSLIKRTAYAAATKEKTFETITGIRLMAVDGRLSLTATNRHRIAHVVTPIESETSQVCIVTTAHMQIIADVFADSDVGISFIENEIVFANGTTTIHSRLLDGTYPPVERYFEFEQVSAFNVSANDIVDAIKLVSITSDNSEVFFEISQNEIKLFGKGETGRTEDIVSIDSFDGEPFRFVANGKYVTEAIKSVNSDTVLICYPGEGKPLLFTRGDNDGRFMVMQFRVREDAWA